MFTLGSFHFRFAQTEAELEQVHALNYQTFVRELGQYADNATGRLVDKFHAKNLYLIALEVDRVVGMLSIHHEPPFSIADRLTDPSILTAEGVRPVEVRLLAIEPGRRHSLILSGLVWTLYLYAQQQGFTDFFISGIVDQRKLYEHLGFEPLGPAVRSGNCDFIPMRLPVTRIEKTMGRSIQQWLKRLAREQNPSATPSLCVSPPGSAMPDAAASPPSSAMSNSPLRSPVSATPDSSACSPSSATPDAVVASASPKATDSATPSSNSTEACSSAKLVAHAPAKICLLPGPVALAPRVIEAFHQPILYHRSESFCELFERVRMRLRTLVGGKDVALMVGSGTLANEAIAATLAADPTATAGLVLVNGEFGCRLLRQAERWHLRPRVLMWPWGKPWNLDEVAEALAQLPAQGWVWGVHHETSTGVLNDLPGLVRLAEQRGIRVCVDGVSSIGAVPVDLRGVYLASGASGKALGSYPGIAMVYADAKALVNVDVNRLPSYLDVPAALGIRGPRFTVPSPLIHALDAALEVFSTPEKARSRYAFIDALGRDIRRRLRQMGAMPLASETDACGAIVTFAPPGEESTTDFVRRCESWGYQIAGQSSYLAERRLVQIAVMGDVQRNACLALLDHFEPLYRSSVSIA